jgi:hypothetical protein
MTASQQLEVDAYILSASNLRIGSRGYRALVILLEHGNILFWCLGKPDTYELAKVLVQLRFKYDHVKGGLSLCDDSKMNYYYKIMHRKIPAKSLYQENVVNSIFEKSKGSSYNWAERQMSQRSLTDKKDSSNTL